MEQRLRYKEEQELRRRNSKEGNLQNRKVDEEQKLEEEALRSYFERQARLQRIGSFKFDIDSELDAEILTSDQVFEDLRDLENIIGKTASSSAKANKALLGALYTRNKKKKKKTY